MTTHKVFGVGLGKTGTTTLGSALKILGYKHGNFSYSLIYAYGRGEYEKILKFAQGFDSFDDYPWPLMYQTLDQRFPDSKFILTRRQDAQTWYRSLCRHAENRGSSEVRQILYGHPSPAEAPDLFMNFYKSHIANVRAYFSERPEKLLEICWDEGDEWRKLCNFLDLPIPPDAFPIANRTGTKFGEFYRYRIARPYITRNLQRARKFCKKAVSRVSAYRS